MERMLIQAQCQKDREKKCKIRANNVEMRNEQSSSSDATSAVDENVGDDADVEMSEIAALTDTKEEVKMDIESTSTKPIADQSESSTNNSTSMPQTSTPEMSPKSAEKASPPETEQQEANEQGGTEHSSEPINIEESAQEIDPSTIINIDPRTYCKLGHFHLLLEDYPKGNSAKKSFLIPSTTHTQRAK